MATRLLQRQIPMVIFSDQKRLKKRLSSLKSIEISMSLGLVLLGRKIKILSQQKIIHEPVLVHTGKVYTGEKFQSVEMKKENLAPCIAKTILNSWKLAQGDTLPFGRRP